MTRRRAMGERLRLTFNLWRRRAPGFLRYVTHRFAVDRGWRMAAGLSYTSLIAVVPLTAIAFSMLAAFPVFSDIRTEFQDAVFANLLPQSAEAMREYFTRFVENTATLSAVGIIGLAATAVLLLSTVEADMNAIFRVAKPRALVPRLLVFWAMITLGPLLLGASFSLSTYLIAASRWVGIDTISNPFGWLSGIAPTLIIVVLLAAFYKIIPNRPVNPLDALAGAVLAGVLFGLLRGAFTWYVVSFPTYQNVYGALSVVPIFLLWMYFSWTVVLFGATVAASLGEWRAAGGRPHGTEIAMSDRLTNAVAVIGVLFEQSRKAGGDVSRANLLRRTGMSDELLQQVLRKLHETAMVARSSGGGWVLARDPDTTTLYEVYGALGLGLHEETELRRRGWRRRLAEVLGSAKRANQAAMDVPLRDILESGDSAGEKDEPRRAGRSAA